MSGASSNTRQLPIQTQLASTATAEPPIEHLSIIEPAQETSPVYPTGTKFWFAAMTLFVVLINGGLDANIVATAVPSITDHFRTVADVGWYSSAFRLSSCAFQFCYAKMYKLFPTKTVLIISNVVFLIGSILCATSTTSAMFVVGRAVTGLGFSGNLSGCFAVVVEILPLERRPVFAGTMAAIESCAIIAAPILGGALTQSLGWRWCFWINLPIGGASLATMLFLFPDLQRQEDNEVTFAQKIRELDLVSNCLFIPSLTTLFLALSWGGVKYTWSDGRVAGLLVVFVVFLAAFLVNQHRRGDSAALPCRIITSRSVVSGFVFTACTNSGTNVLEWYLPTFYQVAQDRTPSESGYLMIPILAGMMIGLVSQGIGTTKIGYYAPFMLFASLCMPVATGLMTTYGINTTLTHIICYSGFVGFGAGIGFQGPQAAVQTTLSNADVNLGIGVILFGQSLGPAVFVAIAQVVFTNDLSSSLAAILPGLTPAFIEEHGLSNIRELVSPEQQDEVLQAIATGLTHTWYLPVALACTTMVGSVLVEWRSVKRKQS